MEGVGVRSGGIEGCEEAGVGGRGGETRGFFQKGLLGVLRSSDSVGSDQHRTVFEAMQTSVSREVGVGVRMY